MGDDGKGDDGKKDDGKNDDQKGDYGGKGGQKVDNLKDYGKKLLVGGRKLHQHGAHPPQKDDEKKPETDVEKKPEKDGDKKPGHGNEGGDKKPGYGKEGGDKAPSAELKAAMEACKKNELCRALMECKMKHKESGGKGHDDKEVCVKEMAACAADETCKGLHMKVQMLMKKEGGDKKEGGYGGKGDDGKKDDGRKDDQKGDYGGKGDQKGDYGGKVGQKVDNLKDYGKKLLGGRKLHQHGAH